MGIFGKKEKYDSLEDYFASMDAGNHVDTTRGKRKKEFDILQSSTKHSKKSNFDYDSDYERKKMPSFELKDDVSIMNDKKFFSNENVLAHEMEEFGVRGGWD